VSEPGDKPGPWEAVAASVAQKVYDTMISAHRGAFAWVDPTYAVAFGNDGYRKEDGTAGDPRTVAEVEQLRNLAVLDGLEEIGFGTSAAGYTWALIFRTTDAAHLVGLVWRAYEETWGVEGSFQRLIARSAIERGRGPIIVGVDELRDQVSPN